MMLSKQSAFWMGSIVLLIIYLIFPGNVDWICDQPLLIAKALESNQLNRWGDLGIAGGNGTTYGPIPNFIYQILLQVTHNLVSLVLIKTCLTCLIIFISLWRISNDLKLNRTGVLFAFLSPLLYFYNRSLWDNVFLIPFSVLFSSSVIRFCNRRTTSDFVLASILAAILFHIHLMAVLIVFPGMAILNWVLLFRKGIKPTKHLLAQILVLVASWPYIKTLLIAKTLTPYGEPQWAAIFLSPLLGLRIFGYFGFFEYFSPNFYEFFSSIGKLGIYLLIIVSAIGPIYYFLGLKKLFSKTCTLPRAIQLYFVGVLLTTLVISFKMKLRAHPHYMNASWSIYFCIFWMAFSESIKNTTSKTLFKTYVTAMSVLLVTYIAYIQFNSGDRGLHFGPTLKNQIEVARQLSKLEPLAGINIEVENFSDFPQRLSVLAGLYGTENSSKKLKRLIYTAPYPSAHIDLHPTLEK